VVANGANVNASSATGVEVSGARTWSRARVTASSPALAQRDLRCSLTDARGLGHNPIEVGLEQAVLHDPGLLELALGVRPSDLGSHLACVLEHLSIGST